MKLVKPCIIEAEKGAVPPTLEARGLIDIEFRGEMSTEGFIIFSVLKKSKGSNLHCVLIFVPVCVLNPVCDYANA